MNAIGVLTSTWTRHDGDIVQRNVPEPWGAHCALEHDLIR